MQLLAALAAAGQRPRRLVYASSTSVYGQAGGETVDESSPTEPTSFAGRSVLAGEQRFAASGLPVTRVRFAGIYGPGRSGFVRGVLDGSIGVTDPDRCANRIHVDDCAGILGYLIGAVSPPDIVVASEPTAATRNDAIRWIARQARRARAPAPEPVADPGRRRADDARGRSAAIRRGCWRTAIASATRTSAVATGRSSTRCCRSLHAERAAHGTRRALGVRAAGSVIQRRSSVAGKRGFGGSGRMSRLPGRVAVGPEPRHAPRLGFVGVDREGRRSCVRPDGRRGRCSRRAPAPLQVSTRSNISGACTPMVGCRRRRRLPGAVAHAGDVLAGHAGRLQRQHAAVAGRRRGASASARAP